MLWFYDTAAYSNTYWTFWDVFMLFFFWIPVTLLWAFAILDVFRNHALSGVAKVLWLLLIIILPFIGVLGYLIFRPEDPLGVGQAQPTGYTRAPAPPPQAPSPQPPAPQSGQPASSAQ